MIVKIDIVNKRPSVVGTPVIVCGNSGYTIEFTFDGEWASAAVKTARFVYVKGGAVKYQDVAFSGTVVEVPILSEIREVYVGVYAGDLRTTTPARIPCERSILCGTGTEHEEPDPDVYNQILEACNAMVAQSANHLTDKNNPHNVTAAQVGARPDTWTPTAEEVGARPDNWMPSASDVGAAPAGYVSGDYDIRNYASLDALISSIYTAMPNRSVKIVRIADNGGTVWGGGAYFARFAKEDSIFGLVTFFGYNRRGSELQKCLYNGEWQPLEWRNPPLDPEQEYRTTERYNGEVVYAKRVRHTVSGTFGSLDSYYTFSFPHGISNYKDNVRYDGRYNGALLPAFNLIGGCITVQLVNNTDVYILLYHNDINNGTFDITMYYTKST